jgi:WD40 repeat protein
MVRYFKDGKRLLSCSFAAELKVWDVLSASELFNFTGHTGVVSALHLSPLPLIFMSHRSQPVTFRQTDTLPYLAAMTRQ